MPPAAWQRGDVMSQTSIQCILEGSGSASRKRAQQLWLLEVEAPNTEHLDPYTLFCRLFGCSFLLSCARQNSSGGSRSRLMHSRCSVSRRCKSSLTKRRLSIWALDWFSFQALHVMNRSQGLHCRSWFGKNFHSKASGTDTAEPEKPTQGFMQPRPPTDFR